MAELRELLVRAVEESPCEGILFSGGLDTSIVATLATVRGTRVAVTVVVGDDAPDLSYATELATHLGLEHVVLRRSLDDLVALAAAGDSDPRHLRCDVPAE